MCNTTFTIYSSQGREFHEKMECAKAVDLLTRMPVTYGKANDSRLEYLRKKLLSLQVQDYDDGVIVTGATIHRQWSDSSSSTSHHCHLYRAEFAKILQCAASNKDEEGFQRCKNFYAGDLA